MEELKDCLEALKLVNNRVTKQDVIQYLNDNDVDYYDWNDLEMYIYYIENCKEL